MHQGCSAHAYACRTSLILALAMQRAFAADHDTGTLVWDPEYGGVKHCATSGHAQSTGSSHGSSFLLHSFFKRLPSVREAQHHVQVPVYLLPMRSSAHVSARRLPIMLYAMALLCHGSNGATITSSIKDVTM